MKMYSKSLTVAYYIIHHQKLKISTKKSQHYIEET